MGWLFSKIKVDFEFSAQGWAIGTELYEILYMYGIIPASVTREKIRTFFSDKIVGKLISVFDHFIGKV